jgi:hypothetical protein
MRMAFEAPAGCPFRGRTVSMYCLFARLSRSTRKRMQNTNHCSRSASTETPHIHHARANSNPRRQRPEGTREWRLPHCKATLLPRTASPHMHNPHCYPNQAASTLLPRTGDKHPHRQTILLPHTATAHRQQALYYPSLRVPCMCTRMRARAPTSAAAGAENRILPRRLDPARSQYDGAGAHEACTGMENTKRRWVGGARVGSRGYGQRLFSHKADPGPTSAHKTAA